MLEEIHKRRLDKLLKIKTIASKYGSKFILWFGMPLVTIYALFSFITVTLATLGAAQIESNTTLFAEYPWMIDVIMLSLNTMMLLPIIAIIIYIVYSTIKRLEKHYIEKLEIPPQ